MYLPFSQRQYMWIFSRCFERDKAIYKELDGIKNIYSGDEIRKQYMDIMNMEARKPFQAWVLKSVKIIGKCSVSGRNQEILTINKLLLYENRIDKIVKF